MSEKISETTIRQALDLFGSAVARDPKFARARVGLAEALLWLGEEGALPFGESESRAKAELTTSLELNDGLAEGHSVLAGLLLGADEMKASEREARRAMELNSSLADPYRWVAQIRAAEGRIDDAAPFSGRP